MQILPPATDLRIHVGAGPQRLDGWVNVDLLPYEGVDHVLDVRESFPFEDARFIFAEHFIEHLDYRDAVVFLRRCRSALREDGVLRISTPNLDWVWVTIYRHGRWQSEAEKVEDCFNMNKGFHGWGHKFLYNAATLAATLRSAGFRDVVRARYGESAHDDLRGLERHEQYADDPSLPHVIVLEASGTNASSEDESLPGLPEFLNAVESP